MEEQEEARWHQLLNAHRTRKILPYCDEQFDEYRDNSVQEFRFVLSQGIREQIFYASFVKNIEKHIKSNHTINALKQVANYAQTECQFRYCGTAIPFLTVRSTAR